MTLTEVLGEIVRSIKADFSIDNTGKMTTRITKGGDEHVVDPDCDPGLEAG